jgi:hypothetical protein
LKTGGDENPAQRRGIGLLLSSEPGMQICDNTETQMRLKLNGEESLVIKHWEPFSSDAKTPWDLRRVVHLHRRAGFAAPWNELQRDLKAGPDAAINRLLNAEPFAHMPADFASTVSVLTDAASTAGDINRLKAAWFYRMLFGPDPVGERLTLLWHNHFATGYAKVQNVRAMRRQNEVFRVKARSKFSYS